MSLIEQNESANLESTNIFSLGGIEEIGKNMFIFEHKDEIWIIDCGIKFTNPAVSMGFSAIVCPFDYVVKNIDKVQGLIITHGHEDHIGGIPYLLTTIGIKKIYAGKMAKSIIEGKLKEFKNLNPYEIIEYSDKTVLESKYFNIDFFRVRHSIPDSFGVCLQTPSGKIVQTGDFRFDFLASGDQSDMWKMVEIGKRGIDVLLCESTNALSPGFSNSEKYVVDELKREIKIAKGRIFMSIFASNMSRIDEIIRTAIANKRKVVLLGRAMINNVQSSISAGILKVPKSEIISVQDYNDAQYPENQLFFLMTGSQGEEMAALNLIASGKHSSIQFNDRDLVILSSNPIPGNYEQVESLINKLYKTGVNVNINSSEKNLHSTGHATQTESQLLIKLICPKYIVPVHGSFDQMTALRKNGEFSGVPHDNLLVVVNGQKIKLFNNHTAVITDEFVDIYPNFVDSNNKLNKDSVELFNNRLKLSENGIVAVTVKVDKKAKKVLETPLISTKGCFSVTNSKNLIDTIISAIKKNIESAMAAKENNIGDGEIKKIVESTTEYYSWKYKNKKPLVKTIIFTAENPVHL